MRIDKIYKIAVFLLVTFACHGQVIQRVYKENGVWKGDISGPIMNYPTTGAVIQDTTAIPDPPATVPIPPTLTSIDNVDPKMVYTGGGWYSGPTTAPGFYGNTMAYSQTANNAATLTFTGTSIEVFCEKKVGHGSATFQVDTQPSQTVNLGVAGPVGSTSVFSVSGLPNVQHTFKLTVVGGANVVFDYVKINGTVVTPPVTGDITVQPGQSIKAAVEAATSGKTVLILTGTYNENQFNVPVGVSIVCEANVFIDFTGSGFPAQSESAMIQLKSSSRVNGNQTISGFTLRGKNLCNGGIMVDNRDNVTIKDVNIQDMTFFGGWGKNASNLQWYNCSFLNTSWASNGWCSGELNIFNLTGMSIHHNAFTNNLKDAQGKYIKGYGIKSMWGDNTLTGVIEHNTFALAPNSIWKNGSGPNIDIEFHDTWVGVGNVVVRFNKLTNMVSATGNKTTGNTGRWIIENNEFSLQTGSTCHVEVACNNIDIKNNIMRGASIITANFVANSKYNDCIVEGNDFVSNNVNQGWGGTFLIGPTGVTNFVYRNNNITKGNYTLVKYMSVTGGVTDGGGNTIN